MKEGIAPPAVGRLITLVAVSRGEPVVTSGTVIVSRTSLLAVAVQLDADTFKRLDGVPVTVLYGLEDNSCIIRGRVKTLVAPDKVVIAPSGPPRMSERREFIRSDVELDVRVEEPPVQARNGEAFGDWLNELSTDPSAWRFMRTTVDLSGSGARLHYRLGLSKGSLVAVSILAPMKGGNRLLHLPSRVVRCRPSKEEEGLFELAVEFLPLPEEVSDILHHLVFEARARALGVTLE